MIQRQQSLWLLLSTICAFLSYKLPFFSGTKEGIKNLTEKAILDGGSNFFLLILTGLSLVLSLITIFMYKDRKLQLKLCVAGIILCALLLIIYFNEIRKLSGSISLSAVFVFAMLAGYILAARGIWKDEKLVKSLDKLR
jgi:magnesium-transporting ATPase (P-type)